MAGERRHLKHTQIVELFDAMLRVLLEQLLEDGPRFGSEASQELVVLATESVRAIAAAPERTVPSHVDQEIERVGIARAAVIEKICQRDSPGLKGCADLIATVAAAPGRAEIL